jgi:Kdo2-lipid IVA lauroyltransferase/acyltransferase
MLSKLLYHLIIKPISLLPFWLIYRISDVVFFILYYFVGYRKKVVYGNIQRSFPEKTPKEIKSIMFKFYRHFCDLILESIKGFSISSAEAQKRMGSINVDIINQFGQEGKDVVLIGGHYGNWELFAVAVGPTINIKPIALFTPLANKFFDQKVKASRSRFGLNLLPSVKVRELMAEKTEEKRMIIFGSDQSPRKGQRAYWMKFLNQETGVQFGAEKFAKEHNCAVVYGHISRLKRGHFQIEYQAICEDASQTAYGEITQKHTLLLEKEIIKEPAYWLWSHKRWKHTRPEGEVLND